MAIAARYSGGIHAGMEEQVCLQLGEPLCVCIGLPRRKGPRKSHTSFLKIWWSTGETTKRGLLDVCRQCTLELPYTCLRVHNPEMISPTVVPTG